MIFKAEQLLRLDAPAMRAIMTEWLNEKFIDNGGDTVECTEFVHHSFPGGASAFEIRFRTPEIKKAAGDSK